MKSVIQRVTAARVEVDGDLVGEIGHGVVVLASVAPTDSTETATAYVEKLSKLAMFADTRGKMGLTIGEVEGSVLLVSQFTLHADLRRGKRPSFSRAAEPRKAQALMEALRAELVARAIPTQTGRFGTSMQLTLTNDGPATFLLDVGE